jgi:hypothetical protein
LELDEAAGLDSAEEHQIAARVDLLRRVRELGVRTQGFEK